MIETEAQPDMSSEACPPGHVPDQSAVPALEMALWYVSLGLIPLPVRSPAEVAAYLDRWDEEHPGAAPDEREKVELAARKRPHGIVYPWAGGRWIARGVTDRDCAAWWGEHPDRPIFLLTGPGTGLTVVDVDTYKGGDPEPWLADATIVVRTPRGGYQFFYAEDARAKTNNDQRARGVDVRARGGGTVAPSGMASPGRYYERFAWPPQPVPEHTFATPRTPPVATPPQEPGRLRLSRPTEDGGLARALSLPQPDGCRTSAAKTIVGMLCRAAPVPSDAIDAADALLAEALGDGVAAAMARAAWSAALRSAVPRSEEMIVELVSLWNATRCDPPWPDDGDRSARSIAASLWRSASAAEALRRASDPAEQVHTTDLPQVAPGLPGPALDAGEASCGSEVNHAPTTDPETEAGRAVLARIAPLAADVYGPSDVEADRQRTPLSCAELPAYLGEDGCVDTSSLYGHGWGPWLDEKLGGGVMPGFFWILAARRAKGSKTAFGDQHWTGLQMLAALNALEGHGPIPQVWILTEMSTKDLERRGAARYLGYDQGVLRRGRKAELAPGVRDRAARARRSAHDIAAELFSSTQHQMRQPNLWARGREFRRYVCLDEIADPASRSGPALLHELAQIVRFGRWDLADRLGCDVSRIWPVIVLDPVQRFAGDPRGQDAVVNADAMIKTLRTVTDGEGWITCCTSDTNQTSARAGATVAKTADAIVAQAVRGTYTIMHVPDAAVAIDIMPLSAAERALQIRENRELEKRARIYIGVARQAEYSDEPAEFRYFPRSGRFVAIDPAAPPPVALPSSASDPDGEAPIPRAPVVQDDDGRPKLRLTPHGRARTRTRRTS